MTQITLTRGQILEICALLADAADAADVDGEHHICANYERIREQFEALNVIVGRRASERQLATLVLAEFSESDL